MKLGISTEDPQIMHIDLNSAFATAEQQAHPSLRGKPVGVTNRKVTDYGCVIAASYEAKDRGVKVGMRIDEAKSLVPELIVLESDPPKYHHVYQKLCAIMKSYSPKVVMKSIDEGIIDFHGTREFINTRSLIDIGQEIKQRVRSEIGSHMRINVGIGPNRFLAKQAAGWHKPDGLDQLDHRNLITYYKSIKLTDLLRGLPSTLKPGSTPPAFLVLCSFWRPMQSFCTAGCFIALLVKTGSLGYVGLKSMTSRLSWGMLAGSTCSISRQQMTHFFYHAFTTCVKRLARNFDLIM